MNKLLRYSFLLLLALVSCVSFAQEATFDWSSIKTTTTAKEAHSYTQAPITLTFDKGTNSFGNVPSENKEGSIRMYVNTSLTISAEKGYAITKVVFTPTGNSYNATKLSFNSVALSSDEWVLSTPAQNVVLTATANARFKKIVVSYQSSSKASANLKWSNSSVSIEKGSVFSAPTFSKATTANVTFTSDNEGVASVNSEGIISLGTETGKATITATAPENDEYSAGSATCTIEVYTYDSYTKANSVESGKKYLLAAQRNDTTVYASPLATNRAYGYLNSNIIKELTNKISVKSTEDNEFTIVQNGGGYNIQDVNGRYYYSDATHNTFSSSVDVPTDTWTVTPQADGTFKIAYGDYYVQWGQGKYTTFGLYTSNQAKAVLPFLYVFDEQATGIQGVKVDNKVTTDANAPIYNLAGQRVSKDYKGVVIQNGKKHINK